MNTLRALGTRYYERAMLRFEAFFATGEGHVRDGDIHTYSMNCNNLAIHYRYGEQRHEEALALYHKGLGPSPFAEHKDGAMKCLEQLERYPEFVEAAEQLWHFAQDHAYTRGRLQWVNAGRSDALGQRFDEAELARWLKSSWHPWGKWGWVGG